MLLTTSSSVPKRGNLNQQSLLPPQNPPRLAILLKPRPLLSAARKQFQRLHPLDHSHRKHIPCILRYNVGYQQINLVSPVRFIRVSMCSKTVAPIFPRNMGRLHLNLPQSAARLHNKIVRIAVAPRLCHSESQLGRLFARNSPPPSPRAASP